MGNRARLETNEDRGTALPSNEGTQSKASGHQRIYALDSLRATMIFLVVLYHCLLSYIVAPSRNWVFKDEMTTFLADVVIRFIHVFTLPTFFMLAGFFSAMLYLQRGGGTFLRSRATRIALPFAVAWMILHPMVGAGFVFANGAQSGSLRNGLAAAGAAMMDGSLFFPDNTMHLWFMYDLMFFYAVVLVLVPIAMYLPSAWRAVALRIFGSIISGPFLRLPILALITFAMLRMVGGTLYASLSFVPNWRLLLGYGLYFGFGWLLYLKRDLIHSFDRLAWTQTLLGVSLFFIVGASIALLPAGTIPRSTIVFMLMSMGATVVWLLFFGLTGLYVKYFNRPSSVIRYIVDSSFWIYLAHLPLAIWLPGLFSGLAIFAWIKILMVLSITYLIGFATYDLFVRPTFIGAILSGRRYPRGLPQL